jgi:molybdopterin molybdotransferase
MLTVAEAQQAALSRAEPPEPRPCPIDSALGLLLAEEIVADLDMPPFDKAIVDGYAVRLVDLAAGPARLRVVEEILAGMTPTRPLGPGETSAIMTGAPMPEGADAVVMVERVEHPEAGIVLVPGPIGPGRNWTPRGREMRNGEVVLGRGAVLDAAKLGLLASVGAAEPLVRPRPVVAIASTGDELVPADRMPGPGQIRNSNSPLLRALVEEHGATPRSLPIIPDRLDALIDAFTRALDGPEPPDVLLVSGGVSAGTRDLVPEAFEKVGVEMVFHKVRVKPGKPLWFGIRRREQSARPTLVFGLPGNPVSGLVCFLLFVRLVLEKLGGFDRPFTTDIGHLPLASDYSHSDERDTYRPARLTGKTGEGQVEPLPSSGSSDLRAVASAADGFAIFPAGERMYREGDLVGFLPLRHWRPGPNPSYLT